MRKIHLFGKVRSIIRCNNNIDYFVSCLEKRKNQEFVEYARGRSLSTITIKNDSINCDKQLVYYIESGNAFSGFGAELRRTLDAFVFADHYGFLPYVRYTDKYLYTENKPINGTTNPFEYYFFQPTHLNKTLYELRYIHFKENHRLITHKYINYDSNYALPEKYVDLMGKMICKYLKMNDETKMYIEKSMESIHFSMNRTIGVHVRGTDFNTGYKGHPNIVSIQDYFDVIDSLLKKNDDCNIFLATDEVSTIDKFRDKYGIRIITFEDAFRSEDGLPIHFSKDNRENHKYRLGLEILRDIVALSKADMLVAGLSQVSYCARFFKSSSDLKYSELVILDKGIHK
jgi:hypothetical protein